MLDVHPPGASTGMGDARPEDVRASLEAILASQVFSHSRRLGGFLRFVVEETLAGRSGEIKEYLVGVEVFDRKKSYDPRTDPIVRVEAGRLREKLAEYYQAEGSHQAVRIELPKGRYSPVFVVAPSNGAAAVQPAATAPVDGGSSILSNRWVLGVSLTVVLTLVAAGIFWAGRSMKDKPAAPPDMNSLAVLPFADLSPGKDQAYFSDGLSEELVTALARVKGLRVAPRSSTASRGGLNPDVKRIGRELGVAAVLDGSVRREGDRLRIAVRVSDAARGYTLWAEMYQRHLRDIFAVQEEISQKIVQSLGARLSTAAGQPLTRRHTTNVAAFNLYLKGRYHWNRRGGEALHKAIGYFEQAIKEDPQYASAYSGLADSYGGLAHQGSQAPSEVLPKAKAAALRALEVDPDLAEAHSSLGLVRMFYDWDLAQAEGSLQRALEIDPQYATACQWYSVLLMLGNRMDEALVYMRRAEELEPLWPNIKRALGDLHYRRGEYDQAILECREALDLDAGFDGAWVCVGRSYEKKGMYREAIAAFEQGQGVPSTRRSQHTAMVAHAYALAGRRDEARKLLNDLEKQSRETYVSPFHLAIASAGLGDKDATIRWLKKAADGRSVWIIGLAGDPRFEFLREDPRFRALIRKLPVL